MTDPTTSKALVRFGGEIATKSSRTRRRFLKQLANNIRDSLRPQENIKVEQRWGRLFVRAQDLTPLERVFGVHSYSTIEAECPAQLTQIVDTGQELFEDRVAGKTFAVRTHRAGEHPFSSQDIKVELGSALNTQGTVDLDNPDVEVQVEVREKQAYFFANEHEGPGGLPLGTQGKALALISGGFDSAVAAWMMMRRGVELDYLFFNLGGGAYQRMTVEVAKFLADHWSWGTRPNIWVADFNPVLQDLQQQTKGSYRQVLLKRIMYRAGQQMAQRHDASALVTGESLGQVSSQTLANLTAIDKAASLPVFRPLIGWSKNEIIQYSRDIGTHDLSKRVREYCSITPDHPVVATTPERAARQERHLDPNIWHTALQQADCYDLRAMTPQDVAAPHIFTDQIPPEAVVIDTRPANAFRAWSWPQARHCPLEQLHQQYHQWDKEPTYVLYCQAGLKTAYLAERMQADGYEAYSFKGGVGALKKRQEQK